MFAQRLLTLSVILLLSTPAFGWGHEGHRIIADIAQDHLTPAARSEVERLMGTDQLANFATWADDIRPQHRETAPWHYVNIQGTAQGYDRTRDCWSGDCVVEKLKEFSATLRDPQGNLAARQCGAGQVCRHGYLKQGSAGQYQEHSLCRASDEQWPAL